MRLTTTELARIKSSVLGGYLDDPWKGLGQAIADLERVLDFLRDLQEEHRIVVYQHQKAKKQLADLNAALAKARMQQERDSG